MIKTWHYIVGVLFKRFTEHFPPLFILIQKLRYRNREFKNKLVDKDTDIVIEGYPRSANSFSVKAFRYAQGHNNHKIGEHTHAYAQIKRAVQLEIPTIVLIRNPYEAVLSMGALHMQVLKGDEGKYLKGWDIKWTIEYYIRFYKEIMDLKDGFVLGEFKEVTSDLGKIIEATNHKFGTEFMLFEHTENHQKAVFKSGKQHLSPSKERNRYKTFIQGLLEEPENEKLMGKAKEVYEHFIKQCSVAQLVNKD